MLVLLIYVIFGFLLYLLNSFLIKKYNITMFRSIIISLLFIFILAGIFSYFVKFTSNIFIILVFYLVIDIIYTTYFLNDDFFNTDKLKYYLLLIMLGFIMNNYFINKIDNVFLDPEQLKLVIWVLIIVYLYKLIVNSNLYSLEFKSNNIDKESTILNYVRYKNKYNLSYEDKDLELIIYALMIYNNRKRNFLMRKIDNFIFNINGRKRKLSIMLIESDKLISDIDGIALVYSKLCDIKKKTKTVKSIINKYDSTCSEDVYSIVNMIKDYFK